MTISKIKAFSKDVYDVSKFKVKLHVITLLELLRFDFWHIVSISKVDILPFNLVRCGLFPISWHLSYDKVQRYILQVGSVLVCVPDSD